MKTEWDYSHLYKRIDEWEKDYKIVSKQLDMLSEQLEQKKLNYHDFISVITEKFKMEEVIEKLYCYGKRHVDQNSTDEEMTRLYQRAWKLYGVFTKLQSKIELFVMKHEEEVRNWVTMPEIHHYKTYLEQIFDQKKHMIPGENQEAARILNQQQLFIHEMYRSLVEQDMKYGTFENHKGKKVVSNNKEANKYSKSKHVQERRDSFLANMKGYKQLENSMASLLNMKLEKEITLAKLKHYDSVMDMRLENDLLPMDTITQLVVKVNEHVDVLQRYIELKKKLSQIDEYHHYDRGIEISSGSSKHYALEESIDMIKKAIAVLGPDASHYIDMALEDGWIDFFEKPHKRKDSFTCISYSGVPYVSVNFHENLQSLRTLGHELGHMIHTAFAKDNQPFEYFEYSLFLAEIASKVNELLVDQYLIDHVETDEEKIFLLDSSIKGMINSLYNQTMMTEFELKMLRQKQEKGMVSSTFLNETYRTLYQKYNGDAIIYDEELENNWEKIPHYYIQDSFYLWQYATGVCLAGKIVYQLQTNPSFKDNYIKFLSLGKSVSVIDALKVVNIDLTDGSYIDDTIKVIEEQIEKLKRLVK